MRKIERPRKAKPKAALTDKQRMRRRNCLGLRDGVPSLLGIGAMFLIGGVIAMIHPIPFQSPGIPGKAGVPVVGSSYTSSHTAGWAVIFILFGLFFLVAAYRHQKT